MAGFSMNKVLGSIKKRPTFAGGSSEAAPVDPANDTPEAIATRCVKQFCQSVGSAAGDDVVFLPSIVEAAVASPAAAAECARLIRKFLYRDYWSKPSCQYNAIMLLRILADNPGPGFTQYMDKKFVDTVKELLRSGRDGSVRQILMEALDTFELSKGYDHGLEPIIAMWKKEKEKAYRAYGGMPPVAAPPRGVMAPPFNPQQPHPQAFRPPPQHGNRLPDPIELANRLEEARTSASLLEQVVACTPPSEVLTNELIREFSDRCASASRSIQGYMTAENPGPDNDTMESLIDTNEQLQQALNQHHRAVLQAKKQFADSRSSIASSPAPPNQPPPTSQPRATSSRKAVAGSSSNGKNGKGKSALAPYSNDDSTSAVAGPSRSATGTPRHDATTDDDDEHEDPFRDPPPGPPPRLSFEPFHPGFGGGSGSGSGGGGGGSGSGSAGDKNKQKEEGKEVPVTPVSEDDVDDVYRATPRVGEAHVYRY